jgi:hypothetical protein
MLRVLLNIPKKALKAIDAIEAVNWKTHKKL